jgi:histidyl-tRNA synthetase
MDVKIVRDIVVLCCGDNLQHIREITSTIKAIKGNLAEDERPALATIDRTSNPGAVAGLLKKPLRASGIVQLVPTRVRSVDDFAKRLEPCFRNGAKTVVIVGEDEIIDGVMRLAGSGNKAPFERPQHLQLISRKCPLKKKARHQLRPFK